MSDRVELLCQWMRQHVERPSVAWRIDGRAKRPERTRLRDTEEGRKKLQRIRAATLKRASQAYRLKVAKRCTGWYDPHEDYWTLSAECPIWADEMRKILTRLGPYQRRRK